MIILERKFVLFGTGEYAANLFNYFGAENVRGFIDNNSQKWGTTLKGKPVYSPEEYLRNQNNEHVVIATGITFGREIYNQIKGWPVDISSYFDYPCIQEDLEKFEDIEEKLGEISGFNNIAICGTGTIAEIAIETIERKHGKGFIKAIFSEENEPTTDTFLGYPVFSRTSLDKITEFDLIVIAIAKLDLINDKENSELRQSFIKRAEKNIIAVRDIFGFTIVPYPELKIFKDIHKGKRCFLIGNGPSLTVKDLEKLYENNEITFGVNKIFHIFNDTSWRPTYYCIQDYRHVMENFLEIENLSIQFKFVANHLWQIKNYKKMKDVEMFNLSAGRYLPEEFPLFSEDISHTVYSGGQVLYSLLQIAAYMGFKEIYLLGSDLNPSVEGNYHFYKTETDKDKLTMNKLYDVAESAEYAMKIWTTAYEYARTYSEAHGFKIYNATRGGKLEVFERVDFDELFK